MRKITAQATEAFLAGRPFHSGNTSVELSPLGEVVVLKLHGNAIARYDKGDISTLEVTDAGWNTATIKDRLNALPGVHIHQCKWVWFLNGHVWQGNWTRINP